MKNWELKDEVIVYCDGRCEGVGAGAVGWYAYGIYDGGKEIAVGAGEAGGGRAMTANVAEYVAVLRGLEALRAAGYEGCPVRVRSDSRLVMQQLGRLSVVRSPRLRPWWRAAQGAAKAFAEVHWEWIPRGWNREADGRLRRLDLPPAPPSQGGEPVGTLPGSGS